MHYPHGNIWFLARKAGLQVQIPERDFEGDMLLPRRMTDTKEDGISGAA
jgi:hypothetical protein